MTITEFARSREVQSQTISSALRRHGYKYNKYEGLTDDMLSFLESEYPEPKQALIVTGLSPEEERELREELDRSRRKLEEAQKVIIDMTNSSANMRVELKERELLLEARQSELTSEKERLAESQTALLSAQEQIELLRSELNLEKQASEDLRKRGLIARILNKGV